MSSMQRTFTIGTVARLVGISTHVLRVWERRYDLKLSARNEKGRRIYTSSEIEKLKLIKQALDKGFKISDIASMSVNELIHVCSIDEPSNQTQSSAKSILIYGERLAHWMFRARTNREYRVISELPSLIREIEGTSSFPDAVLIELEEISSEIEELLYSTRLQVPNEIKIYLFNRHVSTEVKQRLEKAGIEVIVEELSAELIRGIVERTDVKSLSIDVEEQQELTEKQLNNLLTSENSIYCECPQHIGDLYLKINEFIKYSDGCERQSPKDATVHQYIVENLKTMRTVLTKMTLGVAQMDDLELDK
ncbi:MerR family transcriptional regulator [Pleionea sediminis]|uniref:MerR family transcriptional regulator n=1 Tax=Pleionea sediminis TaxID=2569479 RepID=UPI001184C149|nr:MerR family transcriptional regulator [Pleionea sediminis]